MGRPGGWFRSHIFRISGAAMVRILALALLAIGGAGQVWAQATDADFSAYCRAKFPNSSYQSFSQSWGTEHACVQGGTRQGIDFGEACVLTTGSRNYEISGMRVLCEGLPEDASPANANDLGAPDFAEYCRQKFPNSAYEKRAESWGIVHYCRRAGATGGFTLQQIDLAEACRLAHGVDGYRSTDTGVVCEQGGAGNVTVLPSAPVPGPGAGPGPMPPFPIPGSQASPQPSPMPFPSPVPSPNAQGGDPNSSMSPDANENVALACQALGGRWRGDTIPMVEDILAQMQGATSERTSNCVHAAGWVEQCRVGVRAEQAIAGYFQTLLIWQCHVAVIRDADAQELETIRTAREEGCIIQETLSDLQEVINQEIGTMLAAPHDGVLEASKLDDLCAKGVIHFVLEDGSIVGEGETLPVLEPLKVAVEFDRAMKKPSRIIKVEANAEIYDVEVFQRSPTYYLSEDPLMIDATGAQEVEP
jgi:hypothetical protein